MHPSPAVHPRTVASRSIANGSQTPHQPKQQQPRRNGSTLSREERRRRRQLRRRRNQSETQQRFVSVTPSNNNVQEPQQSVTYIQIDTSTSRPYYQYQQSQQRMGYQQINH